MTEVANEGNFLAPLHVKGRSISTEYADVESAKRRIADALGATGPSWDNGVWYEIEYNNSTGVHKITGTLLNSSNPIKGIS